MRKEPPCSHCAVTNPYGGDRSKYLIYPEWDLHCNFGGPFYIGLYIGTGPNVAVSFCRKYNYIL